MINAEGQTTSGRFRDVSCGGFPLTEYWLLTKLDTFSLCEKPSLPSELDLSPSSALPARDFTPSPRFAGMTDRETDSRQGKVSSLFLLFHPPLSLSLSLPFNQGTLSISLSLSPICRDKNEDRGRVGGYLDILLNMVAKQDQCDSRINACLGLKILSRSTHICHQIGSRSHATSRLKSVRA